MSWKYTNNYFSWDNLILKLPTITKLESSIFLKARCRVPYWHKKKLEITHIIKIATIPEYCGMRHSAVEHFYPQIIMNYLDNKNESLF